MIKAVFIGSTTASMASLQTLLEHNVSIQAIFTITPETGTRINSDYCDLGGLAHERSIPIYYTNNINSQENINIIRKAAPDLMFCLGFSQLIKKEILDIPRIGTLGVHATKLPANRGRHPLIWSLVNGETTSALTLFWLDEGTDSGDIAFQEDFEISLHDDYNSLNSRVIEIQQRGLINVVSGLKSGVITRIMQDDSKATYRRKRNYADGQIDWNKTSLEIYNLIRAITHPMPQAHTFWQGKEVKINKAKLPAMAFETRNFKNGQIFFIDDNGLYVKTTDDYLILTETNIIKPDLYMVLGE